MTVCIFLGPTLALADARRALDATYLPPVRQGDIHRIVTLLHPRVIGLIDGYFQWVPSVWHKEILWAIREGVHVFGAASMGALRAAELCSFGMHGVGRIFEAYRDGMLDCEKEPFEDDDEVAVEHGPGEVGYVATSETMVNIRCTLAEAEACNVISAKTRSRCIEIAKRLFFPERSYDALLERARGDALPEAEIAALEVWLPSGRINQKRADALALLAAIRKFLDADPAPPRATFTFEHTTLWERAIAENAPGTVHSGEEQRVLEELRLEGKQWDAARREALSTLLSATSIDAQVMPTELMQQLAARHREPQEISRLIEELARQQALRGTIDAIAPALIERRILERVRATPEYERLLARAHDKQARIAARGDLPDVDEFSDLQLLQLRDWYFKQAFDAEMPDDIEQFVHAWGYRDLPDFHRVIFAEHVYRRMCGDADTGADVDRATGGRA